jgi:hypothetical protein
MMIAKNLISTMLTVLLLWGIVASAYDSPPAIPDNTIYGHVFDAQTGKPLSSVLMYCLICSPNMTNSKGYYEFRRCFSALTTYTIDCVKTGYRKYSRTVTTDLRGKAQVDFYIQPEVKTAFMNATSIIPVQIQV